jgi:CBS domain-containing protein
MKTQDLMSKPPVCCRPSDTLNTAAELMWDHDCGAVLVTSDDGRLVGVLTDRDICMAAYTQGRPLREMLVSGSMAAKVYTCRPNDSLEAAEVLMSEKKIRRVPIVDAEKHPLGLLSLTDVARHAVALKVRDGVEHGVVETLASIAQPRSSPPGLRSMAYTAH